MMESEHANSQQENEPARQKGVAPVKAIYLLQPASKDHGGDQVVSQQSLGAVDESREPPNGKKRKREDKKSRGQNTNRSFGFFKDKIQLCPSRAHSPEFSPLQCSFGDSCRFEHNLRRYLKEGKREELSTLGGICPLWKANGKCTAGWKCRFLASHMGERTTPDGEPELYLKGNSEDLASTSKEAIDNLSNVLNVVPAEKKILLSRRKMETEKADKYSSWLDVNQKELDKQLHQGKNKDKEETDPDDAPDAIPQDLIENRARYTEPPFLPSEKRRIYFGVDTPVLAPLTTQGNMPFRRLCVEFGAQATYSEMAMSLPLIQGQKSEWALMKAHSSEVTPPHTEKIVANYDNSRDLKFGAQLAAAKPWHALKATEVLTTLCPHLRVVDLNCGCPIDLVYRQGSGSALLDSPSKLEKILRGMHSVSGEVPITVKIRMGTRDGRPTALKLVERLALGGFEAHETELGPCGVAAITLHGRSRQQRYTKHADWSYISDCAALIKRFNQDREALADTVREPDPRTLPPSPDSRVYFLGNGDCFSHVDYQAHISDAHVDSVMVARGALIKPWLFEEIASNTYLDKSATERLTYVEKFARYGLEAWGSDEIGVETTRRFLLEWLSFAHRYVPLGILEYLPPSIQDRPPKWKGRNELESLLGSGNFKDWIKISEMFLGPANEGFRFEPKHKSNSYEIEAEG